VTIGKEIVTKGKTVTILVVDDDKVDMRAVRHSFRELKIANPVIEAGDGLEALEHLRGTNGRKKVPHPCLVLLDLNMPRMGGIEFLDNLRADPELHRTVVFVLTTSSADEDRVKAYDHHISGYVLKYRAGQSFLDAISMLEAYWRVIEFPD
jgi:CheY-like chemotaxis protein